VQLGHKKGLDLPTLKQLPQYRGITVTSHVPITPVYYRMHYHGIVVVSVTMSLKKCTLRLFYSAF